MPNPKLIYHLRCAPTPVNAQALVRYYEDPGQLENDVAHLARFGLVGVREGGLVWEGS